MADNDGGCSSTTITIGEVEIDLDLSFMHEKAYHAQMQGSKVPQADIDRKIFERFIRAGDIALDAGANIGVTSAEMVRAGASHVYLFEAHPDLVDRLLNISCRKLTVFPFGLSDRSGEAVLFESQVHNQGSTTDRRIVDLFPYIFQNERQLVVEMRTLDDACREIPFDFMKVDIEGAELRFLRGARQNLSLHRPHSIAMELFDPFFDEVYAEIGHRFKHCYRALITNTSYSLVLLERGTGFDEAQFHKTSPMYIFTDVD